MNYIILKCNKDDFSEEIRVYKQDRKKGMFYLFTLLHPKIAVLNNFLKHEVEKIEEEGIYEFYIKMIESEFIMALLVQD